MCRERVYLLERHYTPEGRLCHRRCYRGHQRTSTLQKSKPPQSFGDKEKPTSNGIVSDLGKTSLQSSPRASQYERTVPSTVRDYKLTAYGSSENTDMLTTLNDSIRPGLGKTGLGSLAKGTEYVQSSGSSSAGGRRQTGSQSDTAASVTTVLSSRKSSTSSPSTGLIKALYSTSNYKQRDTTASESVTPATSRVNISAAGRLIATPASSSSSTSLSAAAASVASASPVSLAFFPVSATSRINATAGRLKATSALSPSAVASSSSLMSLSSSPSSAQC